MAFPKLPLALLGALAAGCSSTTPEPNEAPPGPSSRPGLEVSPSQPTSDGPDPEAPLEVRPSPSGPASDGPDPEAPLEVRPSPSEPASDGPDLKAQIAKARADLAARLGVEPSAIETVEAARVTWRTSALGCPAPDGFYAQMLTAGARIRLRRGATTYSYHSGPDGEPFLCETPEPPARTDVE